MGPVGHSVQRPYASMEMRRRMDVIWMFSDAIKGLFSLDIGKSGTGLIVWVAGKECMFWIISRCLYMHLH